MIIWTIGTKFSEILSEINIFLKQLVCHKEIVFENAVVFEMAECVY